MTSSFENPKTKSSLLSMSTTSTSAPNSSESLVVSSRPPNPAPSTSTRMVRTLTGRHTEGHRDWFGAVGVLAGPRHLAPRLRDVVTVDGRPGLVAERIVGSDLMSLLTGSPWLFLRAATAMATTHAAMHECQAPASLPQLNDELRQRIELAPILRTDLASYALDVLDGLPAGDRLSHGDFHPGNMMGTWETLAVIDWGDASRGDPLADVARTEL